MVKAEFSETQFVVAYLREAFTEWEKKFPFYRWYMPSTATESRTATDLILKYGSGKYKYSVFYQFKRSNFYNLEKITDLAKTKVIDTGVDNSYGFKIYNKSTTKQFNVLQRLARFKKNEVFYCAPLFYTIAECRNYFRSNSILDNSKLIDFKDASMQAVTIPFDSYHRVIFDKTNSYICSDINEVKGYIAREKLASLNYDVGDDSEKCFNLNLEELRKILFEDDRQLNEKDNRNNIFYLREELATIYNIIWIPIFDEFNL
jgi:hypothetical protein